MRPRHFSGHSPAAGGSLTALNSTHLQEGQHALSKAQGHCPKESKSARPGPGARALPYRLRLASPGSRLVANFSLELSLQLQQTITMGQVA